MLLIAIDPGVTGALAFKCGGEYSVEDIPVEKIQSGKNFRSHVNGPALADLIRSATDGGTVPALAIIEQVHPMAKNGVIANFSLGESYGIIVGVLSSFGVKVQTVSPRRWKKAFDLDADKEKSRQLALSIFLDLAEYLKLKKHHNRAEALLLLHWIEENG